MARLKEYYEKEIVPGLVKEFGYTNINQVPRITKIVVNMGLGEAVQDVKMIDKAVEEPVSYTHLTLPTIYSV